MAKLQVSTKRMLIDKNQSTMVATTAIAAFIFVFAIVASHTLISQMTYQNRVISAKKTAKTQLQEDVQATTSLVNSYKAFVGTPQNLLGGNPDGSGSQDGDNAKLALDALPSDYDFPALATSLEKLISAQNLKFEGITGTDLEATQGTAQSSANPQPIAMPFQIAVSGNYTAIQSLISSFGKSIRPFQIQSMQLSGTQDSMSLTITAQTFYQPEKDFNVTTKAVQ